MCRLRLAGRPTPTRSAHGVRTRCPTRPSHPTSTPHPDGQQLRIDPQVRDGVSSSSSPRRTQRPYPIRRCRHGPPPQSRQQPPHAATTRHLSPTPTWSPHRTPTNHPPPPRRDRRLGNERNLHNGHATIMTKGYPTVVQGSSPQHSRRQPSGGHQFGDSATQRLMGP